MLSKLRALNAVRKLQKAYQKDPTMNLKPGITTTEFVTLIATNLIMSIMAALELFDGELAVLLMSAFTAVHVFVRNGFKLKLGINLRPGIQTSEFWAVVITSAYDLVLAALDKVEASWAVAATAALTAVYQIARNSMKAMEVNQTAAKKG
jgi:hypothetical protein